MPGVFDATHLIIFMPYWNRNVYPKDVDYTAITGGIWYDVNTWSSDLMFRIAEFQWLNIANPDWHRLINDSPIAIGPITGEGYFPCLDISSASLWIDDSQAVIDRWWNSNSIGKYGVCSPSVGGYVKMPLTFLNHRQNMVLMDDEEWDALYYNLQPGCSATGMLGQYGHNAESPSKYPPVYWYSEAAGFITSSGNLQPGASVFSVFGPEQLP